MSIVLLASKNKQKPFTATWKTDNTSVGSSANNQVKLPFEATGIYNCVVDWGDGQRTPISAWNAAETTHTYVSIGTYTIKIYGKCVGFRFNNDGDRLKLLNITKWGNKFELGNSNGYFYGCANLTFSGIDILKNPTMTNMSYMLFGCSAFNQAVNFNTIKVNTMEYMFGSCTSFNKVVSFDTPNVNSMYGMFNGCTVFNQTVNLNTVNVNTIRYMFFGCSAFNQVVNFDTQNVTNMGHVFNGCTNFNQDISSWNIGKVTTMISMLQGATSWSRTNYDLFLISAHAQALTTGVQSNVPFRCVPAYTLGGAAQAAHDYLTGTKLWIFTDGGGV